MGAQQKMTIQKKTTKDDDPEKANERRGFGKAAKTRQSAIHVMADKDLENMRDPEQKTMLRFQPKTKIRIRSEKNRILKIRIRKKKDPKDEDPKE